MDADVETGETAHSRTAEATVTIVNSLGLHARASAKFADRAGQFDSEITVHKNGIAVDGTSILDLLTLGAAPGSSIRIVTTGPDARAALDALVALVRGGFGEDGGSC